MTSPSEPIRGAEFIVCSTCSERATRVGAQDSCDVYVCEQQHITRVKVGAPRTEWNELAQGHNGAA